MKPSKLVKTLKEAMKETNKKKRKALQDILKKMKQKESALKDTAKSANSSKEKKAVENKIKVIHAQRKKGVKELRRLKKES